MRRQSGPLEDLMSIAARMSWQAGVTAAVLSWAALHFAAVHFTPSGAATTVGQLGPYAARSLLGTLATLLQYVIPVCFLMGALASRLTQSQARGLFRQARLGGPETVRSMTWREFEQLIGQVLRGRGYHVSRSEPGPDGGVDLVATKGSERVLVQCKHWRTQRVGVKVVRELHGVVAAQGASGGYVVTSGVFSQEAWAFAQSCNIELVDGEKLGSLIREVEGGVTKGLTHADGGVPDQEQRTPDPGRPPCPQCGSEMVRRTARRGSRAGEEFWGCFRYPRCRGTRPIDGAGAPNFSSASGSE